MANWRNLLGLLVPIGVGGLILVMAVTNRGTPEQAPLKERAQAVRVATVTPVEFTPQVNGFGSVLPGQVWDAVAQVGGPIAFVHPDLKVGKILPEGVEIIRISPDQYDIALRQAEADFAVAEAKLAELRTQVETTQASLVIEERSLTLKREDLARKQALLARGATSQASVDTAETTALSQDARVQDLKNSIRLLESQIAAQESQTAANRTRIESAKLDLARTIIRMPFRGRVSSESIEPTQYVGAGTTMMSADGIAKAEVEAKIPQNSFAAFVELATPDGLPSTRTGTQQIRDVGTRFGWSAEVELEINGRRVSWPASVVRLSDTIDIETRTIGVIVSVENSYDTAVPGVRPPLVKGMFVRVTLRGETDDGRIIVPRSAVRDNSVYLMDAEMRLRRRPVEVAATQAELAVISSGIKEGEQLVLSDVAPAIEGMLLNPTNVTSNTYVDEAQETAAQTDDGRSED